ncbi:hypothetical protein ZWY2020_055662 [Hordeum vulgare]|nr:hypothetical protein ZWY2020_055662 [Hordeum vulgare]
MAPTTSYTAARERGEEVRAHVEPVEVQSRLGGGSTERLGEAPVVEATCTAWGWRGYEVARGGDRQSGEEAPRHGGEIGEEGQVVAPAAGSGARRRRARSPPTQSGSGRGRGGAREASGVGGAGGEVVGAGEEWGGVARRVWGSKGLGERCALGSERWRGLHEGGGREDTREREVGSEHGMMVRRERGNQSLVGFPRGGVEGGVGVGRGTDLG